MAENNLEKYKYNNENYALNTQRAGGIEGTRAVENDLSRIDTADKNGIAVATTNIFVYANGTPVGMIQSFQVSENRNINKLQAVGWEGVVQQVPSNTQGGTLTVNRIALYESNLGRALGLTDSANAGSPLGHKIHQFGRNTSGATGSDFHEVDNDEQLDRVSSNAVFSTLRDQRVPFEIVVKTPIRPNGPSNDPSPLYFEERYVDCWIQQFGKTYQVSSITVSENATISYGDVY
jgi:hypothetical protein